MEKNELEQTAMKVTNPLETTATEGEIRKFDTKKLAEQLRIAIARDEAARKKDERKANIVTIVVSLLLGAAFYWLVGRAIAAFH